MSFEPQHDRVSPRQRRHTVVAIAVLAAACVATAGPGLGIGTTNSKLYAADDKANAFQAAREAAHRKQSTNNLKVIALAFHNYYDSHKAFPPAVVMGGKDNKVPHSWRVELLPFLEEADLYAQYKMDEPWDSENNKKVLAKIPAAFRHPSDAGGKPNSSYFVITGKGTPFDGDKGITFKQVKDGTTNTLLVVEAKREIPWTKPEDISYDAKKDAPKFGGWFADGFHGALCDGSVKFIPGSIDKKTLQHVIEIADGNPVTLPTTAAPGKDSKPKMAAKPAAGADAKQQQSVKNLKFIAQALIDYQKIKGRFPAAVVMGGPDKDVPHSWRVEILQFLEEPSLYGQYKMGEPWDSENNKKVLAKMPEVFRNPADAAGKTNTSYYVVASKGTIFDAEEVVKIASIKDGTSNTILVVESKGDVPWTKPDDIAYDGQNDPPKIGGIYPDGFQAAFADGSVKLIPSKLDKEMLKALIEIADGKVISIEEPATPAAPKLPAKKKPAAKK